MTNHVAVTLGDKSYPIRALNMKASRAWRESFGATVEPLIAAMSSDISAATDLGEIARLLAALKDTLLAAPDLIADALFAYAPNLPRAEIEEVATDTQAMAAFVEVLQLAYPFSALFTVVRRGLTALATEKNSN